MLIEKPSTEPILFQSRMSCSELSNGFQMVFEFRLKQSDCCKSCKVCLKPLSCLNNIVGPL